MTKGVVPKEVVKQIVEVTKYAQIVQLVKDNQLLTALGLFILWQTGAFLSAYSAIQGGMC